MVHNPMYKRLMRFVEDAKANETPFDYNSKHNSTLDAIRKAEERIRHFRECQGFRGQTGDAINKWLGDTERRVRLWKVSYLIASQVGVEMRRVMKHAREKAETLSPVLVNARLDKLHNVAEVTIPVMEQCGLVDMAYNAVASAGAAIYDATTTQASNQREASPTSILQRPNDSMQGLANSAAHIKELQEELEDSNKIWDPGDLPQPPNPSIADQLEKGIKDVSSHNPGVYPGNRDTDYGRSDLRGPNSGLYSNDLDDPTAQDTDAEKLHRLQSERVPDKLNKDGELSSRNKPIIGPEDLMGIDLLHSCIGDERYANGTIGGYASAPPNDRHHPLWNINGGPSTRFDTSGHTNLAGAGALSAGTLGVTALGARGASGLSATSLSGLGCGGSGGLGAGGLDGLHGGSATGGGFGAGDLPGDTSASSGTAGLTSTNGVGGAARATGKAGAGSTPGDSGAAGRPGMGGPMGAGAGADVGGGKDDKRGRRRRYKVFKFEDDEGDTLPPNCVNPMLQTYGPDKDLKPASQKDDGWDPRQW